MFSKKSIALKNIPKQAAAHSNRRIANIIIVLFNKYYSFHK